MINTETVEMIARLSRISVDDTEKQHIAESLGDILEYVEELSKVDTTHVSPMAYLVAEHDALRDDVPHFSLSVEALTENAPLVKNGHFAIPKVIG